MKWFSTSARSGQIYFSLLKNTVAGSALLKRTHCKKRHHLSQGRDLTHASHHAPLITLSSLQQQSPPEAGDELPRQGGWFPVSPRCLKVSLHTPPGTEQREDPSRDMPKFNTQTHPGRSCPAPAQGEIGLIRSPCCLQASRVKCPVINQRKFCSLVCAKLPLVLSTFFSGKLEQRG